MTEITQSQENPLLCLHYLKVFTMKYSKMLPGDPGLVTTMLKLFLYMCVCMNLPLQIPTENRRGYSVPWSWSYTQL